jgi:mannose-6-phosphate isomerase-like protein (cupin superfamily)
VTESMVMNKQEEFFRIDELEKQRQQSGKSYLEFLRIPAASAGLYTLAVGSVDPQKPHKEDELYYVVRGRACIRVGSEEQVVGTGSVIFVAAEVEHRFHDISEELVVLVFFAPAES